MSFIGLRYQCSGRNCDYSHSETVNAPGCTTVARRPIELKENLRCPECGDHLTGRLVEDVWSDDGSESG